jgi:hypothetical protein
MVEHMKGGGNCRCQHRHRRLLKPQVTSHEANLYQNNVVHCVPNIVRVIKTASLGSNILSPFNDGGLESAIRCDRIKKWRVFLSWYPDE